MTGKICGVEEATFQSSYQMTYITSATAHILKIRLFRENWVSLVSLQLLFIWIWYQNTRTPWVGSADTLSGLGSILKSMMQMCVHICVCLNGADLVKPVCLKSTEKQIFPRVTDWPPKIRHNQKLKWNLVQEKKQPAIETESVSENTTVANAALLIQPMQSTICRKGKNPITVLSIPHPKSMN